VNTPWTHTTVLLNEAVEALLSGSAAAAGTYVDATFGRGGHARAILARLAPEGRLIAFDKDAEAVAEAARISDARFSIRHQGFRSLGELPDASVAGVLMDLGVSSPQIDNPVRGFSFRFDGPLDMRMDTTRGESVAEWLATAELQQIAEVIRDYGQNPATRTFQAFRIFINAELEELQQALEASLSVLQPGGRLAVISFHSLEDRIVKQFIAKHSKEVYDRRAPFAAPKVMKLNALERIKPSQAEVSGNPRSRSAILRVAERTEAN
jgi:16S rRNA (cytosine1402-N4)-methyltransferase